MTNIFQGEFQQGFAVWSPSQKKQQVLQLFGGKHYSVGIFFEEILEILMAHLIIYCLIIVSPSPFSLQLQWFMMNSYYIMKSSNDLGAPRKDKAALFAGGLKLKEGAKEINRKYDNIS